MKAMLFTITGVALMVSIAIMSGLQWKPKPADRFEHNGCLEIRTNAIVEIDTVGDSIFIYILADSIDRQ